MFVSKDCLIVVASPFQLRGLPLQPILCLRWMSILKENFAPLLWLLESIYFEIQKSYIFVSCFLQIWYATIYVFAILVILQLRAHFRWQAHSPYYVSVEQILKGNAAPLLWLLESIYFEIQKSYIFVHILLPFKRRFDMQRFMSLQFLLFCSLANSIEKDQRSFHKIFLNCNTP